MKLKIEELIADVREEFLCYEEGEGCFARWEKEFSAWIAENKGKRKDILQQQDAVFLKIQDEEEIFEIVDSYLDAIAEGSVPQYWKKF